MEKSLSFFRVFDIAFFAPGILLFAAIGYRFFPEIAIPDISDSTPRAIALMTVSLALIYLLGLLCHGLQRGIRELLFRRAPATTATSAARISWFQALAPAAREDLALYFWYMRATCWNLAVAVIPSSFLFSSCFPGVLLLGLLVSFALALLGAEFDRSLHRAVN